MKQNTLSEQKNSNDLPSAIKYLKSNANVLHCFLHFVFRNTHEQISDKSHINNNQY